MATPPLEHVLNSDMEMAAHRLGVGATKAQHELDAHDHKVREMPWYERAFTYMERRHERAELVNRLDRAAVRMEVAWEMIEVMREAAKQHQQALERQPQRDREPERTREERFVDISKGLSRLAHEIWGRDSHLEHGHYVDANKVREVLKDLGYTREWVERSSERERSTRSRADDLGREL
jgi:soluble cytochrome b562